MKAAGPSQEAMFLLSLLINVNVGCPWLSKPVRASLNSFTQFWSSPVRYVLPLRSCCLGAGENTVLAEESELECLEST